MVDKDPAINQNQMIGTKSKLEHKSSNPGHSSKGEDKASSIRNPRNNKKSVLHDSPSSKRLHQNGLTAPGAEQTNSHLSGCPSNSNLSKQLADSFAKTDKSVQLHERLKNLHLFYKNKIDEEKAQTTQRNNVFLSIIQEMQTSHQEKVLALRKMIEEAENQKRDVGLVDDRMNQIKGSIDQILKQSAQLKASNDRLEKQIHEKELVLREKEEEVTKIKEEIMEARTELESFERLNLKENKRNKEIVSLIDKSLVQHQ